MSTISPLHLRNRLLASLPPEGLEALWPHLERHSLEQGFAAELPDRAITHVFFPEPGVLSVVAHASANMRLEAGIIGPEGMSGLAILNGTDRSPHETFVQIPCRAWRVEAGALRAVLREHRAVHDHLLLFAQAFSVQLAQNVLANGRATLIERLARWLLMCHDRADREDLPLTHEFLSVMLGVRRAGVTTALQVLDGGGAVRIRRGLVVVRDRVRLRDAAGDGYGGPEAEYARLFGAG